MSNDISLFVGLAIVGAMTLAGISVAIFDRSPRALMRSPVPPPKPPIIRQRLPYEGDRYFMMFVPLYRHCGLNRREIQEVYDHIQRTTDERMARFQGEAKARGEG